MNPANEIIIDEQTGQTLAKLARHKDDARAFVKAADVEPQSFEQFLRETGQMGHPAAREVLVAASVRSVYRLSVSQFLAKELSTAGDVVSWPFRRLSEFFLPMTRRTLVERYVEATKQEFAFYSEHYILPDESLRAERMAERLAESRQILIYGAPGIGKSSLCRYLTSSLLSGEGQAALGRQVFPLYLPLNRYTGHSALSMTVQTLAEKTGTGDLSAATSLLRKGGFVFFFDGMDEVDDRLRFDVESFVHDYSRANYFCFSARSRDAVTSVREIIMIPEFSDVQTLAYAERWLDHGQAFAFISRLQSHGSAMFRKPLFLRLALENMHPETIALANTPADFYEAMIPSMLKSWRPPRQSGSVNYDALCRIAFEMLERSTIDLQAENLSLDTAAHLVEQSIIVKSPRGYQFFHETLRDYLASVFLIKNWKEHSAPLPKSIDTSWLPTLQFAISTLSNATEAGEFLSEIGQQSPRLSLEVFRYATTIHRELGSKWGDTFFWSLPVE